MSFTRKGAGRHAFTLVELLVVIGIIALLISILLPTLSRARAASKAIVCLSNERQLGMSMVGFIKDYNGWMPKGWFNDTPRDFGGPAESGEVDWEYRWPRWGWEDTMTPYLGEPGQVMDNFRCPGDASQLKRNVADNNDAVWQPGGYYEEFKPEVNDYPASYRYNVSNNPWWYRALKASKIKDHVNSITFLDGAGVLVDPNSGANWNQVATYEGAWEANISEENMRLVPIDRHNDAPQGRPELTEVNVSFLDGHGEKVSWKKTWEARGPELEYSPQPNTGAVDEPTLWRQTWAETRFREILWNYSAGPAKPGSLFQ